MRFSSALQRSRRLWVLIALLALPACAVVDQYSDRAIVYNLQAEQAQEKVLLLNIVRASLRRPMQFTGLQTITGTASASGTVNATGSAAQNTPFISLFNLIPPSSSTILSRSLAGGVGGTASMSGGPTFSVPVLDTQEFYQGFLTPISGQLFDLYLQEGYPRDVLFNLMIEKIIIKRTDASCPIAVHTPDCELTIRNYAPEDVSLELFQGIIGYMIRLGLSTEQIVEAVPKKKAGGDTAASDAAAKVRSYGFCFAPTVRTDYARLNPSVLCGHPAAAVQLKSSEIGRKSIISGVFMSSEFVDELYDHVVAPRLGTDLRANGFAALRAFAGKRVSISFNTRSIEGILYYLGEVVRRQTHPEGGQSTEPVQVRVGPPQNPFPQQRCPFTGPEETHAGYRCTDLFVVHEGLTGANGIVVDYDGITYSISSDTRSSWTMPVFDVVKQLQAINTSAKQLPASNLISVLSNQ